MTHSVLVMLLVAIGILASCVWILLGMIEELQRKERERYNDLARYRRDPEDPTA